MDDIILQLSKKVYEYYPIGLPSLNEQHPGYESLRLIIEKKINSLIAKQETEWTRLASRVQAQTGYTVYDQAYEQFPNIVLRIDLGEESMRRFTVRRNVYLVVSLLTDHFTIYCDEEVLLRQGSEHRIVARVLSKRYAPQESFNLIKDLESTMGDMFPGHQHVSHDLLFGVKMNGGVPHGEDQESMRRSFPLYNFLFGRFPFFEMAEIAE
ncbi:hypothetical protein WBG78_26090 [Chryseolinea sp. T2]|uniref:hypothetical protein n=1 Tax=Chryseolinea sp. T2 TaxID=3129255 RepID=UPI0030786E31